MHSPPRANSFGFSSFAPVRHPLADKTSLAFPFPPATCSSFVSSHISCAFPFLFFILRIFFCGYSFQVDCLIIIVPPSDTVFAARSCKLPVRARLLAPGIGARTIFLLSLLILSALVSLKGATLGFATNRSSSLCPIGRPLTYAIPLNAVVSVHTYVWNDNERHRPFR